MQPPHTLLFSLRIRLLVSRSSFSRSSPASGASTTRTVATR